MRVLIAEDEAATAKAIKLLLEKANIQLILCITGMTHGTISDRVPMR